MKKYYISILLFTLLVSTTCSKKQSFSQNQSTNMSGTELLSQLIKYEKEHTEDFCSKIDLANRFLPCYVVSKPEHITARLRFYTMSVPSSVQVELGLLIMKDKLKDSLGSMK